MDIFSDWVWTWRVSFFSYNSYNAQNRCCFAHGNSLGISPARAAEQLAFVGTVWTVVDAETAEAIRSSATLARFASFEVRTTHADGGRTWTGRYLYGEHSYLEVFGPRDSGAAPKPVGAFGLELAGDRAATVDVLKARLTAMGVKTREETSTRKFGSREIPWYKALSLADERENAPLSVSAFENLESYMNDPLARIRPSRSPEDVVSRTRYLGDKYLAHSMKNIVRLEFIAPRKEIDRVHPMFEVAGFRMQPTKDGEIQESDEASIVFHYSADKLGLRRIEFSLNAPVQEVTQQRIGHSTLAIGPDATPSWSFDLPSQRSEHPL